MSLGLLRSMQALATRSPILVLVPRQVLFQAGDHGSSLFCVLSGEIELRRSDASVEIFRPGDVLGVGGLVEPAHQRLGTAAARGAVELIEIDRALFLFVVQELPMFALELMASFETRFQDHAP
jgi:hypothetical protein